MLKIENYTKLKYKVVGKMGWYVDSVIEQMLYDPMTFATSREQYHISITNRTYSKVIILHRTAEGTKELKNVYKLQNGNNEMYIDLVDIRDMDKFLHYIDIISMSDK